MLIKEMTPPAPRLTPVAPVLHAVSALWKHPPWLECNHNQLSRRACPDTRTFRLTHCSVAMYRPDPITLFKRGVCVFFKPPHLVKENC